MKSADHQYKVFETLNELIKFIYK